MRRIAFFAALIPLLAATGWFYFYSWTAIIGPPAPPGAYISMAIGTVYAFAVVGAMAALIYAIRSRA